MNPEVLVRGDTAVPLVHTVIVTQVMVTESVTTSVPSVSVGPVIVNSTKPVASVYLYSSNSAMVPLWALELSVVNTRVFSYLTY